MAALPLVSIVLKGKRKKKLCKSRILQSSHVDVTTRSWIFSTVGTVNFISVPEALLDQNPGGVRAQ